MSEENNLQPSTVFFVVIFEGRTGSSYLVSCLNSHPRVLCYPEILADVGPRRQERIVSAIVNGHPVEKINPYASDKRYYHEPSGQKRDLEAVGFKTKLYQVRNLERFFFSLQDNAFKLIYLKRKNIIKSVLSLCNAHNLRREYGIWNAEHENRVLGAVHVDPEVFVRKLKERILLESAHEKFYEAYGGEKKIWYYEDLVSDQDGVFCALQNYLNVTHLQLSGKFFKNTPDTLSDAIENYDEIRNLFIGTSFEQFLET